MMPIAFCANCDAQRMAHSGRNAFAYGCGVAEQDKRAFSALLYQLVQ
jgi:hypothetical protein